MDATYERQLAAVAGQLPEGPCLVALIPTIEADQAAGLAADFAQLAGRERPGHTILLSLEGSPAALDHEIGVEGGPGLSDILAGRITLAQGAAHGGARGYIYVPAGETASSAEALVRSAALRSLCASAVERGATVLAFAPPGVLSGDFEGLPIEGLVWLGGAPTPAPARPAGRTLGTLLPPGGAVAPHGSVHQSAASSASRGRRPILTGASHHRARRDRRRRRDRVIIGVLVAVFATALVITAFVIR